MKAFYLIKKNIYWILPFFAALFLIIPGNVNYYISDNIPLNNYASCSSEAEYAPYLVFLGVVSHVIMKILYSITENVNWFALYFTLGITWTFCTINSVLLHVFDDGKTKKPKSVLYVVFAIVWFINIFYVMHLDMAMVALLMILAFGMQFFLVEDKKFYHYINMIGLLIVGCNIRMDVVAAMMGLTFMLVFEKWENKQSMLKKAVSFILLVGIVFGATLLLQYGYEKENGLREYRVYEASWSNLLDKKKISYDKYADEIQQMGLTQNDIEMTWNWLISDKNVYTQERVVDLLKIQDWEDRYEISIITLLGNMLKAKLNWVIGAFFLLCFLCVAKGKFAVFTVSMGTYAILLYFNIVQRVTGRMVSVICISGIILATFLVLKNCNEKWISFFVNKKVSILLSLCACLILSVACFFGVKYMNQAQELYDSREKKLESLEALQQKNPTHIYLTGEEEGPLNLWEKSRMLPGLPVQGGWTFSHPHYSIMMQKCGLGEYAEKPYLSLLLPHVYLLDHDEFTAKKLQQFFREHYNKETTFEIVDRTEHHCIIKFKESYD